MTDRIWVVDDLTKTPVEQGDLVLRVVDSGNEHQRAFFSVFDRFREPNKDIYYSVENVALRIQGYGSFGPAFGLPYVRRVTGTAFSNGGEFYVFDNSKVFDRVMSGLGYPREAQIIMDYSPEIFPDLKN